MEKTIDVVYVLGTGSNWNDNEIRFSLRSLEKNLKGIGKVFVVGECPDFLQNVIHIPAADIFNPSVNADGNIIHKVLQACKDERLSDDFVFINDDHILLKEMEASKIPALQKGDMKEFEPAYWKFNYWRGRLYQTMLALQRRNLPTYHFDCHVPIIFNKEKFVDAMNNFNYKDGVGLTMKSLYGNIYYGETGKSVLLVDQKRTVFIHYSVAELNERLDPCSFLSFNDGGLNRQLIHFLITNFPDQSSFEKTTISDRYTDIATWLAGDRNYDDGVRLFEKYMHGVNVLKLFKAGYSESLRKKLEYKFEHVFDGR